MYEMPPIRDNEKKLNPYHVLNYLFDNSPNNKIIVASSGSIVTNVWHMIKIKKGDSYIISSQGDMGFELPVSIGCAIANKDKIIIPIMGEGSLQLNIQELQTIIHHNLPIKILIFNNDTHGATKMTQHIFFNNIYGVNKQTGISFPNTEYISNAYGIKYLKASVYEGPILCEIFCCIQSRYPRLNAIKNEDGTFTNRPFEDMDPFMDREEFHNEMIVKTI
jgi:acetolactate synthase-1/2/3 large subunit